MNEEITPEVPAVEAPVEPTAAELAETKEWDDVANEMFPPDPKKEEKKDEPAKPETPDEKTPKDKTAKKDEKPDAKPGASDDVTAKTGDGEDDGAGDGEEEEVEPPDTTALDARVAAREAAQEQAAVKSDIRSKMFAEVPQVLQDADGDPIKSVEDVMKLINPNSGQPFTQEEAGMWLLSAQQQFNQNLAAIEKQIDQIAEVNLDLKDQADIVQYEFGELLKVMPQLRDELWAEYEKTLEKDAKSGIITKAPVSLSNFYKVALAPYVQLARKLEADENAKTEADATAAAKTAADAEAAKKKNRADRSDIYGGGKTDVMDPEEKEWADAANEVFGSIK